MADSGKKQVPLRLSAKLYDAIAAWAEDDFRSVNGPADRVCTTEKEERCASSARAGCSTRVRYQVELTKNKYITIIY